MAKKRQTTARQTALQVLCAVEAEDAYVHIALNQHLRRSGLDKRDRALATELVYGTWRRRLTLDWVLEQYSRHPLEKMPAALRNNLRMAVYQILFLDTIPAAAACNEAVELAKGFGHRGTAGLVNGILRSLLREPEKGDFVKAAQKMGAADRISLIHSHPRWLVEHWLEEMGPQETEALCSANNLSPPTFVRANTVKVQREELVDALREEGVDTAFGQLSPEAVEISGYSSISALKAYRAGYFAVQDEASMLAAHALAPRPDELIYDLCAGLGGKTLHIGALMENKGRVLAFDIHPHKLDMLKKTAKRLGISNVITIHGDSTDLQSDYWGKAAGVLLDAPCSGWGVIRRKPDIRWRIQPEIESDLIKLQRQLLVSAYHCLAAGGRLVYSTCTINRRENEENVAWLVEKYPDLEYVDVKEILPIGSDKFGREPQKTLQLLPHRHGTDGFFLAVLRKTRA
ncbi:MAG: 16S rRNA (cytosine(967)-C(5))-methyltransferase RsmB [Firmicutes bacterium]|nr:16S rRNA (cytosine(967)-C(5))-methyltransferase RsmB [Bacillota bacterium]